MPAGIRRTAQQKAYMLEPNRKPLPDYFTEHYSKKIWQVIRLHYGFQSTGAHFIVFTDIRLEPDERPEDLFQRLVAFIDDNLLRSVGNISHHDQNIEDEEMTPTLKNVIFLTW